VAKNRLFATNMKGIVVQNFRFLRSRFGGFLLLIQHIRAGVKTCLATHKA
jgi:hypothetical protein